MAVKFADYHSASVASALQKAYDKLGGADKKLNNRTYGRFAKSIVREAFGNYVKGKEAGIVAWDVVLALLGVAPKVSNPVASIGKVETREVK